MTHPEAALPKVALFVTCLVDFFRPEIGFAAAALIERAGCEVVVPAQTCCGQPGYNAGDRNDAIAVARKTIATLEGFEYVVVPSGSCAGMIKIHYPALFQDDEIWAARAGALASKTHELFHFLVNVRGLKTIDAKCVGVAACHDSCSSLRELGVAREPRALLEKVEGLTLRDIPETETCCGFGGLFAVKYPEISARMADDKLAAAISTGATVLVGGDLGCLLHLAGRASRTGKTIDIRHSAEIVAGLVAPAIGRDRR